MSSSTPQRTRETVQPSTVGLPASSEIPKELWVHGRPPQVMPNRLRRTNSLNYGGKEHARISTIEADDDPITFDEAMSHKDANKWQEAMEDEIKALKKNQVYGPTSLPQNANLVNCRWVHKIKRRPDGKIERYRARLVAR